MTLVTLVSGPSGAAREQAIADRIDPAVSTVVILEGFPAGNAVLENTGPDSSLKVLRIAIGCMCCTGNLVLRVTLNRVLRNPPQRLFLSIADAAHAFALRTFLEAAPYSDLLQLTEDCRA